MKIATFVDNINGSNVKLIKVIENGHIYIALPDGRRYNADGKMIY